MFNWSVFVNKILSIFLLRKLGLDFIMAPMPNRHSPRRQRSWSVATLSCGLAFLACLTGPHLAPAADATEPAPAITLHLGLQGDDNAEGSREHPLRTMAAAMAKIDAAVIQASDARNWTAHVLVEPGIYSADRGVWKFLPWPQGDGPRLADSGRT